MELNSNLLTYATAYKLIALLLALLAIMSFPQLLRRCETNMVVSYHVIPYLQRCYAWIVTSSAVHNYWKCYINVVTWTCLGLYWYIRTLPWRCASSGVVHIYNSNPCCCVTIYYVKRETKYYLTDMYVTRYDKSSLNSNAYFHHYMICWCTYSAMYWCRRSSMVLCCG